MVMVLQLAAVLIHVSCVHIRVSNISCCSITPTPDCDSPGVALGGMAELLDMGVDAFIGPACSGACGPTQLLASNLGLPQVCSRLCPLARGKEL